MGILPLALRHGTLFALISMPLEPDSIHIDKALMITRRFPTLNPRHSNSK